MYVETVPNRNSPPAILLRQGWREGSRTRKRTLANLSDWPPHKIETLRRLLRDETLVSPQDLFRTQQTLPHGHVEAILSTIRKLGLDAMISAKRCRERDLVLAMIAERLLDPCSKLATTRQWHAPPWPKNWRSRMPRRMIFTRPWTGCWSVSRASRRSW